MTHNASWERFLHHGGLTRSLMWERGVIGETRSLGEQARQCESRDGCPEESLMLVPMYVNFAGGSPQRGLTRRLRRGWWGCRPRGEKSFLSKRKKGPKKARGTATPEAARPAARYSQISAFRALPCPALVICSGLPVANCLRQLCPRQLCPLGTRSLSAQASVCGSPFWAVLEHGVSDVTQLPTGRSARLPPSLRVVLGCAQGPTGATLPFGTVCCAHPPGKRL